MAMIAPLSKVSKALRTKTAPLVPSPAIGTKGAACSGVMSRALLEAAEQRACRAILCAARAVAGFAHGSEQEGLLPAVFSQYDRNTCDDARV